jgi:hypothetical protein
MILGVLPSMTATAELVVPKSIPMTWPFTFSSVEFHLRAAVLGSLKAGARAKGAVRGSWKKVSLKVVVCSYTGAKSYRA